MRRISVSRSRQRCQSGSVTIEFALVFPVLVALLFVLLDAGRYIATRTMLAQAAAAAARAACMMSTTTAADVTQAANEAAPALGGMMTVTPTCAALCVFPIPSGSSVEVAVSHDFVAGFFTNFRRTMTNSSLVTCS